VMWMDMKGKVFLEMHGIFLRGLFEGVGVVRGWVLLGCVEVFLMDYGGISCVVLF